MTSALIPRLQIIAAAVLFSTSGAGIKGNELTDWQVASFRSLVAVIALLVLIPESRRGWSWRAFPVAVFFAATLLLFALATKRTTAANAIFLQAISPAYLVVLSPLILKEPIRKQGWFLLTGLGCGFALLVSAPQVKSATAPDPLGGNLLAIASGISFALTVVGLRWFGRSGQVPISIIAMGNLVAFIGALPMCFPLTPVGPASVAGIVYLGVFQIGLAYLLLTRAIRHVPAFELGTLLLVEPALNPLWTWIVVGERPAALSLLGGAIIVLVSLLDAWRQRNRAAVVEASAVPGT